MSDHIPAPVSAEEAKSVVFAAQGPVECPELEPGRFAAFTIPAFLIPIATQLIAQYGPAAVDFLKQAASAGIEELAKHFNITPKAS